VLAAVNGHAVGAGACVAMACDLAIVSATAKIGFNFTRLGIHPGMGGSWTLPRLVGPQRAAELLYTGRLVTGEQAAAYGMALEAVPTAEVLPRTLALRRGDRGRAPQPVRQLKRSLAGSATARWPAAGRRGVRAGGELPHRGRRGGAAGRPGAPRPRFGDR
jgi:enoyl-CoA hydratase